MRSGQIFLDVIRIIDHLCTILQTDLFRFYFKRQHNICRFEE